MANFESTEPGDQMVVKPVRSLGLDYLYNAWVEPSGDQSARPTSAEELQSVSDALSELFLYYSSTNRS